MVNLWLIMVNNWNNNISGWWFGTWLDYDFPYIGNFIIPTDELIFFRGVETTNYTIIDMQYVHDIIHTCMYECIITYIQCVALHCIALYCIALRCIALHCVALRYVKLRHITSHHITSLHITSHHITLHACIHTCIPKKIGSFKKCFSSSLEWSMWI